MSNTEEFSCQPYLEEFKNDPRVLLAIKNEKDDFAELNDATKIAYAKKIIIDKQLFGALSKAAIDTIHEQDGEIAELKYENNNLIQENKFYKETLDDNKIVYEEQLKDRLKNNEIKILELRSRQSIVTRLIQKSLKDVDYQ